MPFETHLSISAMVLGGAFDRLPTSLRLCFAHGGGAFPFLLGRLENAWHERTLARGKSAMPPSHYLDRFSVDSAVFDQRALGLLIDTMGAERVLLGSDYPFPLGEQQIGQLVRSCDALSDEARAGVMGGNALAFFDLPASLPHHLEHEAHATVQRTRPERSAARPSALEDAGGVVLTPPSTASPPPLSQPGWPALIGKLPPSHVRAIAAGSPPAA